jgi:hypothetical protein
VRDNAIVHQIRVLPGSRPEGYRQTRSRSRRLLAPPGCLAGCAANHLWKRCSGSPNRRSRQWGRRSVEPELVGRRSAAKIARQRVAGALGALVVSALLAAGGLRSERVTVAGEDLVSDSGPRDGARRTVPTPPVRRPVGAVTERRAAIAARPRARGRRVPQVAGRARAEPSRSRWRGVRARP